MTPSANLAAFRFGYGLPLPEGAPITPDTMLAALAGPDEAAQRFAIPGYDWVHGHVADVARNKQAAREDALLQARLDGVVQGMQAAGLMAMRATLARAIAAPDGLRERLVAFWADHFTVGAGGREDAITPYAFVEDALRPHLTGRFADMLLAVVRHPGMLRYLDQTRSVGPNSRRASRRGGGLNENLARELLELHTMGVGAAYDQTDVRQLALLLTGLTYDDRRGFSYDDRMAEPGPGFDATVELARSVDLPVIASGGVKGLDDIHILSLHAVDGIEGVITGRALYEGRLDLAAAIAMAGRAVG